MSDSSGLPPDLFDRLTLSVVKSLEKRLGVSDICLKEIPAAERHLVLSWEQRNSCILPDDLKRFYLTSNGFHLQWCVKFEDQPFHLGLMEINPIEKVAKLAGGRNTSNLPSLADVDYNTDDDDETEYLSHGRKQPHFDLRSRVFELDPCNGYGKTCLVYNNTTQGVPATDSDIWFLDRSLHWHFIADTFSQYFRLMIMNLGLPLWHFTLTDIGLPNHAQQWFYMYAPLQLNVEVHQESKKSSTNKNLEEVSNKIDVNKVFKGKSDKKSKSLASVTSKKKTSSSKLASVRATLSSKVR
ncbi:tubulin polyglutamylase complex subunit 2-like [Antedon mediterranea]|uniref:tubulin polyglutamylase complex subunit 2-like n=1 Tax=Antedon mediterranea TaxID=105859 RepID=UPI003AF59E98